MTFVFRTSSFFVVFVITVKATTFVVSDTANSNNAANRLNDHVERLVDEAVRFRGEARESADKVVDMALALHILGDRMIECALGTARAVANHTRVAMRRIVRPVHTNAGTATTIWQNLGTWRKTLPMPKKEDHHGGYIAIGQCG
ncbi:hypothetical protein HAP94_13565 [Acidithiobacillus ferrivorans]|nr:hypothetical protein [Acidithiobacillus ferrivorans]